MLDRLLALPVSTWSYDSDPRLVHMGPMAQDFAEAFGVGDGRSIEGVDYCGVLLVALQALAERE